VIVSCWCVMLMCERLCVLICRISACTFVCVVCVCVCVCVCMCVCRIHVV